MRLIDADTLDKVKFHPLPYTHITPSDVNAESYERGWNDAIDAIMSEASTIEERKTGKWIIKAVNTFELAYGSTGYEPVYECSICGGVEESYLRLDEPIMPDDANFPNYCPNCGADMRGEGHE